jgi:phospholipid/cholesterol/gamma-HCH transport system substrate-binding protein
MNLNERRRAQAQAAGGLAILAVVIFVVLRVVALPNLSVLPAPTGVSGATYPLSAQFTDVLNLPVGAKVKLNGVTVGRVESIGTRDYVATAHLAIAASQHLPEGTTAQIRFSTPLGELYIALALPARSDGQQLRSGMTITAADTSDAPTIEDMFASLSLLLNEGSLDQINVIAREMSTALQGNTGTVRQLLNNTDQLLAQLNASKGAFDASLRSITNLADSLQRGDAVIKQALETFPQVLAVVNGQKAQLQTLISSVDSVSRVSAAILQNSGSAMVGDVAHAAVIIRSLAGVRAELQPTLNQLIRLGEVVQKSVPGDYLDANATIKFDFNGNAVFPSQQQYKGDSR